jgi:hypothetical protein
MMQLTDDDKATFANTFRSISSLHDADILAALTLVSIRELSPGEYLSQNFH